MLLIMQEIMSMDEVL